MRAQLARARRSTFTLSGARQLGFLLYPPTLPPLHHSLLSRFLHTSLQLLFVIYIIAHIPPLYTSVIVAWTCFKWQLPQYRKEDVRVTYTLPTTFGIMRGPGMWLQGCPLGAWSRTRNGLPVSGNVRACLYQAMQGLACIRQSKGLPVSGNVTACLYQAMGNIWALGNIWVLDNILALGIRRKHWLCAYWVQLYNYEARALGEWSMQYYQPT